MPAATGSQNGYLTSTDWTIFNNKGTFTLPSLTSGSVTFSNGSTLAQNNAKLFWDNTNNRLGIGNSVPSQALDVTGKANVTGNATISGTVGIGTTTPRGQLDVAGTGDIYLVNSPNTGTTQSLYLPGHIFLGPYNGTDISYLQVRRADTAARPSLNSAPTTPGP